MIDFFSLKTEAFGLEITDYSIRIVKLKRKKKGVFGEAAGSFALRQGIVKCGDIKDEARLVAEIRAALSALKITTQYVVMSLPENRAFLQVIQMPRLSAADLRSAVIYEAENYIPMSLDKMYLDFEVIPGNSQASRVDVLLAALPRDVIETRTNAARRAGLKPVAMELESQAAARSIIGAKSFDAPVVIIQIGDANTNLIIYAAGSIRFVFSIPISNRHFIETIAANLGVTLEHAEALKSRYGVSRYGSGGILPMESSLTAEEIQERKIFEALIPGLVDFFQQTRKYVDYYHSHPSQGRLDGGGDRITQAILCGSGAGMKGLDEFISLKLGVPVLQGNPWRAVGGGAGQKRVTATGGNPHDFSVAVGLAFRGLGIEFPATAETTRKEVVVKVIGKNAANSIAGNSQKKKQPAIKVEKNAL